MGSAGPKTINDKKGYIRTARPVPEEACTFALCVPLCFLWRLSYEIF